MSWVVLSALVELSLESICSLSIVLFHGQGWCILLCLWPEILSSVVSDFHWVLWMCIGLDIYWDFFTVSIGEKCGRFWFLFSKQWPVDIQGHDIVPCSWVIFTVILVQFCIMLCWHPQWLYIPVVFQLVETADLYCLHIVEWSFRDFTLWRCIVVCCLLICSWIWLLHPWFYCCLYSQFMIFFRFWSSCVVFPHPFLPSWNSSYSWSIHSSHPCSIQHPSMASPSLGVMVLLHSSNRICAYSGLGGLDFCPL